MAPKIVLITCVFTCLVAVREDAPRPRTNQTNEGQPVLTNSGLDIPLQANPVPQTFQYYYVGNSTVSAGARPVPERFFDTRCRSQGSTDMVVCNVKPVFGARFETGGYLLGISNVHGGYLFAFRINHAVQPPVVEDTDSVKREELIGLSLVALVLLLVVAVICLLVFRHKRLPNSESEYKFNTRTQPIAHVS